MNSLKVFEVNLWGVWPVPGLVEYFAKYAINENLEEDTFVTGSEIITLSSAALIILSTIFLWFGINWYKLACKIK